MDLNGVSMAQAKIKVGGYAPAESVHSMALDHFRDFVSEASDGAVEVEVLHNVMDLGRPAADLFEMVSEGELIWCYFSTSYLGPSVSLAGALEIPFLFETLDQAHTVLDGAFGELLSKEIKATLGYEVLGFWDNGFRHLTNRVRRIISPADCEGLTIRLQPNRVHELLAGSWGMMPVPSELSEGIQLIADGKVDAQENPLANTFAYGVDHEHVTLSAHLYGARGLFANAELMSDLGDDVAAVVRRGARSAIDFQREQARLYEGELLRSFKAEGRSVVELSSDQRQVFAEAAESVIISAREAIPEDVIAML